MFACVLRGLFNKYLDKGKVEEEIKYDDNANAEIAGSKAGYKITKV